MRAKTKLPEVVKIKYTTELKVGMVMCYTGEPRGTGMYPPDIGTLATIRSKEDIIGFSIEMIERGRGWWPTKESYDKLTTAKQKYPCSEKCIETTVCDDSCHLFEQSAQQHPEKRCKRCGGKNPTWSAPNELWNKVNDTPDGILCPACFEELADCIGENIIFRAESLSASPSQVCPHVKREGESCPLNNNCTYPDCLPSQVSDEVKEELPLIEHVNNNTTEKEIRTMLKSEKGETYLGFLFHRLLASMERAKDLPEKSPYRKANEDWEQYELRNIINAFIYRKANNYITENLIPKEEKEEWISVVEATVRILKSITVVTNDIRKDIIEELSRILPAKRERCKGGRTKQ